MRASSIQMTAKKSHYSVDGTAAILTSTSITEGTSEDTGWRGLASSKSAPWMRHPPPTGGNLIAESKASHCTTLGTALAGTSMWYQMRVELLTEECRRNLTSCNLSEPQLLDGRQKMKISSWRRMIAGDRRAPKTRVLSLRTRGPTAEGYRKRGNTLTPTIESGTVSEVL